jgi:hydrogenase nickel incorporation protein HypA/HybF
LFFLESESGETPASRPREPLLFERPGLMHELSLAQSILDIVLEEMAVHKVSRIETVSLKVGVLTAVVPDALSFCWKMISEGTPAEGSVLEMESIQVRARCEDCGEVFEVADHRYACPACGGSNLELLSGREFYIHELRAAEDLGESSQPT